VKRFLIALGWLSGLAYADTPLPFGLDIQARDWIESNVVSADADISGLADLDQAIDALNAKERELGPYHPDLIPLTVATAKLATDAGALARAERLYDRALHTVRVNDGLYGDQQLPILRGLLDLYLASGDREGFEKRAEYQFRLLGSGLPPFNAAELAAAGEFFDVTLDALMDARWEGRARELLRFHDRFDTLTESVCADPDVGPAWCQFFSFRLIRFYYLLEYKLDVFVDDPRFEPRFGSPDWDSMEREPRMEALQRRLFQQGEVVFDRLLAIDPGAHDGLVGLADWHWFYQKRTAATRLYREACRSRPGRFSLPAPLPEYPTLSRYRAFRNSGTAVNVTLQVNERGAPSDIVLSLIDAAPDAGTPVSMRRKLRETRFRPAFDDCESPSSMSELNAQWVFLD